MGLTLLALSVAVLAAGPILAVVGGRWRPVLAGVDGFILGSLGGIVCFFLLPDAFRAAGAAALVAALAGLVLFTAMERWAHIEPDRTHGVALALALGGLLLHTVVDGIAVHADGHGAADHLGEAVVIHRLPVAVAVWWLVRPRYGRRWAASVLVAQAAATVFGYVLGDHTLAFLDSSGVAVFSAFVAGALLHVLFHRAAHQQGPSGLRVAETVGLALGVALLVALPAEGKAALAAYGQRFLDLALESAPAVLLGFLMAGVVVVALPLGTVAWLRGGGSLRQALKGTVFGIPIPICSCGVVPLYQGLLARGAPPSAALAFLVATPELGIESLFLSVPLLGVELTVARLIAALLVALLVGWLVGRTLAVQAPAEEQRDDRPMGIAAKARGALRYGLRDVVGDTAAWILAGVAVAAAVDAGALERWLAPLPFGVDVALATVVGVPLYVCASGATPLAAALLWAGISPGAAIAFLLAGPATNVTTFGVLSRLHSRKTAAFFGAATLGAAVAAGIVVNLVFAGVGDGAAAAAYVPSHAHGAEEHGALAWAALVALAAAFVGAIVREGPTAFLRPLLAFGDPHHDDDGHHHGHDHDHDHHGHGHHHDHDHDDHDHHGHHHDDEPPTTASTGCGSAPKSGCCH